MGRARCRADVSADGRFAAAGAADGAVFVWDLKPPPRGGGGAAGGGDSGGPGSRRASLGDSGGGGPLGSPRGFGAGGAGGAGAAAGVVTWSGGGAASGSGAPFARLAPFGKEQVAAVQWSADGRTLVAGDKAGAVAFWRCANV